MKGIRLEPARGLLENFTHAELSRMVKRSRLGIAVPRARVALADSITRHLSLDEIIEEFEEASADEVLAYLAPHLEGLLFSQ